MTITVYAGKSSMSRVGGGVSVGDITSNEPNVGLRRMTGKIG